MNKLLMPLAAIVSLGILFGCASHPSTPQTPKSSLASKIVGTWVDKKVETFRADGTWTLQKFEGDTIEVVGSWSVTGNKLKLTRKEGPVFIKTIISITHDKLVTEYQGVVRTAVRLK